MKILIGIVIVLFVAGAGCGLSCLGFNNASVDLETQIDAQVEKNQAVFDKTWKSISQTANVAEAHADKFKEIIEASMKGRYEGKDNLLFMAITEANQGQALPTELYAKVQQIIEANNAEFTANQIDLTSKVQTYNKHLKTFPNTIYAGVLGFPKLDLSLAKYKPVTSDRTDKAFTTGKDEPIMPFAKKPQG